MSDNPFLLPEQSVVSFSGGRTSGLMAKRIADAHDAAGAPRPVYVFCNTGRERTETLDFVHECDQGWGLGVRWLEYRFIPGVGKARGGNANAGTHTYEEVNYETASRQGEPFRAVILARNLLPNPRMRFCTGELKIRTTNRFVRRGLGWEAYHNAIGLRADEPDRVFTLHSKRRTLTENTLFGEVTRTERGTDLPPGESPVCPLADAGVILQCVLDFWSAQPFDLALPVDPKTGKTLGGNCDLCFLKGSGALVMLMRQWPEASRWWAEQEQEQEQEQGRTRNPSVERFRKDRPPYKELQLIADGKATGPGWLPLEDWHEPGCDEMRCTD
jgi:hypothetical protein